MREWTEQEEQEMIERAKTGDAQANYELSQWALRRGEEEPDEPRWNRLAAKCLVKAAQAGYGPAQEQMESLLHPQQKAPQSPARRQSEELPEPVRLSDARQAAMQQRTRQQGVGQNTARRPAPRKQAPARDRYEDEDEYGQDEYGQDEYDDEEPDYRRQERPARQKESRGRWGESQWRMLEIVCVAICAVLLVLIAVMIITGRRDSSQSGGGSTVPAAGDANTAQTAATAEPEPYPDDATRAAIEAAGLEITPLEEDYEKTPSSATVSVTNVTLRLRKGPSTTYTQVAEMQNGTVVPLYARKAGWALVRYDSEDGPVYGWCSADYLIITAGSAETGSTDGAGGGVG